MLPLTTTPLGGGDALSSKNLTTMPQPPYPSHTDGGVYPAQEQDIGVLPHRTYPDPTYPTEQPVPAHANPYSNSYAQPEGNGNKYEPMRPPDASFNGTQESEIEQKKTSLLGKKLSKKWQRRLYWIVPLAIVAIVFSVLFEVYKSDFERWVKPLTDWLRERESWSWVLPTAILFILSFPPLFGHEIVQLVVGLTYPLGVGIGIASLGAILGEAACFIVFKYGFTWWVDKKIEQKIKWAATARVAQEAGFRGVLIIRYSIVPPHLANPLFSCTGMTFWLYMITVVLSLPKTLVFVVLGSPGNDGSKAAKWGKVVAIGVVVIITIFASWWIRKKMTVAIKEIEAERAAAQSPYDEELGMLGGQVQQNASPDTSYHGAGAGAGYQGVGNQSSGVAAHESGTETYQGAPLTQPYSYEGAPGRAM